MFLLKTKSSHHSARLLICQSSRSKGATDWSVNSEPGNSKNSYLVWPLQDSLNFSNEIISLERHWGQFVKNKALNYDGKRKQPASKYVLPMFPYPSGRLHMGHLRVYSISDVLSRYYNLNGFDVLHPIGWDAFGLPAENAAFERGLDPSEWTYKNITEMRTQLNKIGAYFDWDREIFTNDPKYYRWTQWIFLKLFEHGLVKHVLSDVFWDPVDQTTLAAEQVDHQTGKAWRSDALVQKRKLKQWAIETPRFAKRLLQGLQKVKFEWGEVAAIQSNWIGKCDVYRFLLPLKSHEGINETDMDEFLDLRIKNPSDFCFAKFIILSPNHALSSGYKQSCTRYHLTNTTTYNFVADRKLPILIDFGLSDQESFLDARLGNLSTDLIDNEIRATLNLSKLPEHLVLSNEDVLKKAQDKKVGGYQTSRTLLDWVVSRQRKWGTPIPMLLNERRLNAVPVPEEELPVLTKQRGKKFSSSKSSTDGYYETDTLDTFFDSSWYFLRYLDPENSTQLANRELIQRYLPVDVYIGGVEHADIHLFYARFISHFLYDIGILDSPEPFRRLLCQGVVKAKTFTFPTGEYVSACDVQETAQNLYVHQPTGQIVQVHNDKMSKSKKNGVDPQDEITKYGIDLTRLQMISASAPRLPIIWGTNQFSQIKGLKRLLNRAAWIVSTYVDQRIKAHSEQKTNSCIKNGASEEFYRNCYNGCVRNVSVSLEADHNHCAALDRLYGMFNVLRKMAAEECQTNSQLERCIHSAIIMLQLFAPHSAAELWSGLSKAPKINQSLWDSAGLVFLQRWPKTDNDATIEFVISLFGRIIRTEGSRHSLENLETDMIVELAKGQYFARYFDIFKRDGLTITEYSVEKWPGLRVALNIEMADDVTEKSITKVIDELKKLENSRTR